MPKNEAAWLVAKHQPLEVKDAPYPEPGAGEIVVRNHAVAVNPVNWMKPYIGDLMFSWIKYPFVLGSDLAGEVAAVGDGVDGVKVGDRVLAVAAGMGKERNRASEGAFQAYTVVLSRLTTVIPEHVSYEEAAVVPLGLTTAACGLFQSDLLALELPGPSPKPRDRWVIIWGGATSVGSNAIQLAVAAGYGVVATASPRNFDYVRSLGAAYAFDYRSPDVARDIIAALDGKEVVGAFAIGAGSALALLDILPHCQGRKFIANCSSDVSFDAIPKGPRITLSAILTLLIARWRAGGAARRKSRRDGITVKFFDASSVIENEIGPAIYRDYLGPALAERRFRPAPPPTVAGHGLGAIQTAFDVQRAGVSAAKVVVSLP
ncbi:MAG TPA: zinc-binding alcohol dehydrogenase family protein [Caulobacteraceae bacterium]|nr:zinc-binding alcohol dehydrogenase family protein [Caulobacteraceae bacterium]